MTSGLRSRAVDNRPLSLGHLPQCVARKPPREVHLRIDSDAGPTEAERHVAGLVHRDAAHPTVVGIGRIGSLLENGEIVCCIWSELIPSHPDTGPGCNAVVDDQSFVIAEVAVRQAVHEAITERIQLLPGPALSDTRAARIVARQSEHGGRERGRTGQGRVRWGSPVDMELPEGELPVDRAERNHVVRRSGRWLSSAVEVGGQQTAEARAHIETLLRSRLPSQHARSVVSTDLAAGKIATRGGEEIERRVIGVWPHTYFGVIRKVCVAERVAIVGTGWIGRRRHNRYSFSYTDFPDYPKVGVWPDAYYATFNFFT